jgi:hypothetical protein
MDSFASAHIATTHRRRTSDGLPRMIGGKMVLKS